MPGAMLYLLKCIPGYLAYKNRVDEVQKREEAAGKTLVLAFALEPPY